MNIQPSLTQNDLDVTLPANQLISIGSIGDQPTTVQLQTAYPNRS